ncbi:MAG: hypothetical protein FWH46_02650 [Methanimicrococcus sp.]|nr:hypothetical protein [Methanimicrococcus sp.]
MIDSSILPQLLVYSILLFAAFIFIRQILKLLKGDVACSQCSSSSSCPQRFGGSRSQLSCNSCQLKASDESCKDSHSSEEQAKKELNVIRLSK